MGHGILSCHRRSMARKTPLACAWDFCSLSQVTTWRFEKTKTTDEDLMKPIEIRDEQRQIFEHATCPTRSFIQLLNMSNVIQSIPRGFAGPLSQLLIILIILIILIRWNVPPGKAESFSPPGNFVPARPLRNPAVVRLNGYRRHLNTSEKGSRDLRNHPHQLFAAQDTK